MGVQVIPRELVDALAAQSILLDAVKVEVGLRATSIKSNWDSAALNASVTGPRTIADSVAAFANFFAKGGKISLVKQFFTDKMSFVGSDAVVDVVLVSWMLSKLLPYSEGCLAVVAVGFQPCATRVHMGTLGIGSIGAHLLAQGHQGSPEARESPTTSALPSLWISIISGLSGSEISLSATGVRGAIFALAFAAATLAVDGAKLGVGEMLRVSLLGVAGTGVGVVGLLRDVGAVVLLVGVVLLLDVVPVPSVAFRSDAAQEDRPL